MVGDLRRRVSWYPRATATAAGPRTPRPRPTRPHACWLQCLRVRARVEVCETFPGRLGDEMAVFGATRRYLACLALALVLAGAAAGVGDSCNGIDMPDGDFPFMPLPLPPSTNITTCAAMCQSDPACAAWAYLPPGCVAPSDAAVCYLKASQQPPVARSCRCSGLPSRNVTAPPANPATVTLSGPSGASVSLGGYGMASLSFPWAAGAVPTTVPVVRDTWTLVLGSDLVASELLPTPRLVQTAPWSATLQYAAVELSCGWWVAINATYEVLSRGQGVPVPFVRKSLYVQPVNASGTVGVDVVFASVHPWGNLTLLVPSPFETALYPSGALGGYGAFARLAPTLLVPTGAGVLAALENSFVYATALPSADASGLELHAGYHPGEVAHGHASAHHRTAPLLSLWSLPQRWPAPLAAATRSLHCAWMRVCWPCTS